MEASDPSAAGFVAPVACAQDHPYLNKMQHRGGGFALLCAFYFHPNNRGVHYKTELIRAAQAYCDDAMEPNYWAGRTTTAGWKSTDSLTGGHGLVHRNSMSQARHQSGYAGGQQDEFTLTMAGQAFVTAMLEKWPTDAAGGGGTPRGSGARGRGRGSAAPSTASKMSKDDEQKLRAWLVDAAVGGQYRAKLSNARRMHLHRVCQALGQQQGLTLRHESEGQSEPKILVITVEPLGAAADRAGGSASGGGVKRSRSLASMSASDGRRLGSDAGRGRAVTIATPQRAARDAAEKRMRLTSGEAVNALTSNASAARPAAAAAHAGGARAALNFHGSIRIDEDGWQVPEDDELGGSPSSSASAAVAAHPRAAAAHPRAAAASAAAADIPPGIRLLVDSRERVSNDRPRQLLDRLAELSQCRAEIQSLKLGDYAWVLADGHMASTVVERKRIADLVGRSAEASGCAHMEQISRLRELRQGVGSGSAARCFLLLEGKLDQASTHVVWDQTDDDEGSVIDSKAAIYEMIASMFVETGRAVQVIHTADEEGTCRWLAQLSVVVASTSTPLMPRCTLSEFNRDNNKSEANKRRDDFAQEVAESLGDPEARAVGKLVSARWSSWKALESEYQRCSSEQTQCSLLLPLCPRDFERWSRRVSALVAGRENPPRDVSAAAQLLSRRVEVTGTESVIGLLRNTPGSEAERIHFTLADDGDEGAFGWASLRAFGANVSCSDCYSMVLITGKQLVSYLESMYRIVGDDASDLQVVDGATTMLMNNLDSLVTKHGGGKHELVVFEGVVRECKRHTTGRNSSGGFNRRVRTLCVLAIALLQHRTDRSFLSIDARDGGGKAGCSVSDNVLQALIHMVRDRSFLYNTAPTSATTRVGAASASRPPGTAAAAAATVPAVLAAAAGAAPPAAAAAAAVAPAVSAAAVRIAVARRQAAPAVYMYSDHHRLDSSDEDPEEEALLTMPSPGTGRQQPGHQRPASPPDAHAETIDLLDSDSEVGDTSAVDLLDDSM